MQYTCRRDMVSVQRERHGNCDAHAAPVLLELRVLFLGFAPCTGMPVRIIVVLAWNGLCVTDK